MKKSSEKSKANRCIQINRNELHARTRAQQRLFAPIAGT
jgi:hypothetical protein